MATSIDRVRRAVAQTPWAILPEKLEQICEFLAARADGKLSPDEIQAAIGDRRPKQKMQGGGVAVLPVYGTISQRMDMLSEMSGGTSTENLGAAFDRYMADPDISTIVLDVDSPGGTVPGVLELSDKIFEARGKGKRIIAVANSMAASAAYWIASAADEIYVTPSGVVGSVGVYSIHMEYAEALENEGIGVTVIKAGEHKAEGNPYEKLDESARSYAQKQIDEIYGEFVGAVARNRGLSTADVEADFGQGRVVKAKGAVKARMADGIGTLEGVLADLGVSRMQRRDEARVETVGYGVTTASAGGAWLTHPALPLIPIGVVAGRPEATVYTTTEDTLGAGGAVSDIEISPENLPASKAKEKAMSQEETAVTGNGAGAATENAPVVTAVTDFKAERERAKAITELCEMHGIKGEAGDFIGSGATVQAVVSQIRERASANLDAMKASHLELSEPEKRQYSLSRAIMASANEDWSAAGFEREISQHIEKSMPKDYKSRGGFFYPIRAAGLEVATTTAGGHTVFTQEGDFIDLLRARMKVAELGATLLTGLEGGTIAFPKQSGASTWSWVDENPGSDVSDTDATFAQVLLAPKAGQTSTAFSRQLLQQSSIDTEMFVRNDLTMVAALGIDSAAIEGTGSNNQPTGILSTQGIGDVAGGSNGLAPTYANMVDLETAIAVDNADIGSMAYLTTPGIRGKLKKTQQFASTNGVPVWTGGREGEVNGYPGHVSTQVPSDLTKGTSTEVCHAVIFGVWSQLLIGYWGALELVVDPYTLKKQAMIEVTSYQSVGLAIRHAEAFAAMKDALTT